MAYFEGSKSEPMVYAVDFVKRKKKACESMYLSLPITFVVCTDIPTYHILQEINFEHSQKKKLTLKNLILNSIFASNFVHTYLL